MFYKYYVTNSFMWLYDFIEWSIFESFFFSLF